MELKEVISIIGYYEEAWLEGMATIEKENEAKKAIEQVKLWQSDSEKLARVDSLFTELEIPEPYDLWLAESLHIREQWEEATSVESYKTLLKNQEIVTDLERLIEGLSKDTTSEMADCNQYIINDLEKVLHKKPGLCDSCF